MSEMIAPSAPNTLPDFNTNWAKIKNYLPRFSFTSGWEKVLNSITVTWRDNAEGIGTRIKLFSEALALPNVPQLEVSDASECLKDTRGKWGTFVEGVRGIANGVKYNWDQIKDISKTAKQIEDGSPRDIQATALLQAISETHKEGRTPEWMRQRIAQHAFDELVTTGLYRVIEYSGNRDMVQVRTTQDDFNSEKSELMSALDSKMWDKEAIEKRTTDYKNLRKIILSGDNSVDAKVANSLKSLWDAGNSEGVTKKSALHYLQLAEDTFKSMQEGGAFDIDLNEESEDE
jgi:hypothetical protein